MIRVRPALRCSSESESDFGARNEERFHERNSLERYPWKKYPWKRGICRHMDDSPFMPQATALRRLFGRRPSQAWNP